MMISWYAIYTKPGCEARVSSRLYGSGFRVLNPLLKERKLYRRKLREVVSPLFPCYIFAELDLQAHYRLVKYTRGVRQIVGNEAAPQPVPGQIIDSILSRMENGLISVRREEFSPGECVSIKGGAFEGFEALFEREMGSSERVSILLKALNARITLDRALLARL